MTTEVKLTRRWTGISPEAVRDEIEALDAEGVADKPRAMVDRARPKNAPLHPAFEWDNKKAGEAWRVHQARNLIRSVRIVTEQPDGTRTSAPLVVHVPAQPGQKGSYELAAKVIESPDLFLRAMTELEGKVAGARRAVEDLARMAKGTDREDTLAALAIVAKTLETASATLARIHH